MSQAGYTPISLYYSTTAAAVPTSGNLVAGELAINTLDGKLYYKNSAGTVTLLASSTTVTNSFSAGTTGLTPNTATTGAVTLAGTLVVGNGGTGQTTLATGALGYGQGTSAHASLAIGTAGQILTVNSGGTAPQWSTLSGVAVTTFSAGTTGFTPSSATSGAVTLAGTLATTNGGTGLTSFTSGGVVYASSGSALATGSALTFDGTNLATTGYASAVGLRSLSGGGVRFNNAGNTNFSSITAPAGTGDMQFDTGAGEQMRLTSTGLGIGAATTGKFLAYQSNAIQNNQGAYGSSGTFQTGNGALTLGGGSNPRGIGVLINANRDVGTTLTYGNNFETFGLIAVANVGTGGGYGTTGVAGYAESDGGVYGLRADAKTTSVGGASIAVGLYVGSVTGSTTNYGVYVNDTTAVNYFGGSVGVGTSSPIGRIDVVGSYARFKENASGAEVYLRGYYASVGAAIQVVNSFPLLFLTSNTEAARINVDGVLQVGRTAGSAPDGKLQVVASGTGAGAANTKLGFALIEDDSGNGAGLWLGAMTNENTGVIGSRTATGNIAFQTYNGGWGERMRLTYTGNLLVGATSTSGSVGNYGTVVGGLFRSFSGTTAAVATNTYITLFTASSGTIASYLVTVWLSADDVANYQANVIVNTQGGTSTKVTTIVGGNLLVFQMSGYSLQAAQLSGGTSTISYSAIRIGA